MSLSEPLSVFSSLQKQFCEKEEEGIIYLCTFFLLCVQTVSQCSVNVNRVVMCLWGQVFDIMCLERKKYLFMESLSLELNEGHWGRDQKTMTQLLVGFLHACVCVEHLLNMHALKCVCTMITCYCHSI